MNRLIMLPRLLSAAGALLAVLSQTGSGAESGLRAVRGTLAAEVAGRGWLLYSARSEAGDWDIFACRPDGTGIRNLTRTPKYSEGYPVLCPDGKRMLYRRIDREDAFDGNNYGSQGEAMISGTDGTGAWTLGAAGQFPWACWNADASRLVCLGASGVEVFDGASLNPSEVCDRKGFFQQIAVSPNGSNLVGVANGFGTTWSVGRYDMANGRVNPVSIGDSCTPDWYPDGQAIVFSHKPPGQKANGGYGWTQLWAAAPDGSSRRLLFAEEGRHAYGGHVSPDGLFVVFTGNHEEDGDASRRGARMSIMRLADAPIVIGACPEARLRYPHASDGPLLDLPEGWEPWWTASALSPPSDNEPRIKTPPFLDPVAREPVTTETELTARLLEIPEGAIRADPLYRYAAVLRYEVMRVHRGEEAGKVIFVAHYRPQFPRSKAADPFRPEVHGSLGAFHVGDLHRMVLLPNAEKRFIGGVINNHLDAGDIFWAVRTDPAQDHR